MCNIWCLYDEDELRSNDDDNNDNDDDGDEDYGVIKISLSILFICEP